MGGGGMERRKQEGGSSMGAAVVEVVKRRGGRKIAVDAVEATVAGTSGALEGVVAARHELAAAVQDVATEAGGVVPEALPVTNCTRGGDGRRGWLAAGGGMGIQGPHPVSCPSSSSSSSGSSGRDQEGRGGGEHRPAEGRLSNRKRRRRRKVVVAFLLLVILPSESHGVKPIYSLHLLHSHDQIQTHEI